MPRLESASVILDEGKVDFITKLVKVTLCIYIQQYLDLLLRVLLDISLGKHGI